jgi:hypothetical protein
LSATFEGIVHIPEPFFGNSTTAKDKVQRGSKRALDTILRIEKYNMKRQREATRISLESP